MNNYMCTHFPVFRDKIQLKAPQVRIFLFLNSILLLFQGCSSLHHSSQTVDADLFQDEILLLSTRVEQKECRQAFSEGPASLGIFLELFWSRRDPTPGTTQNEFKARWEARKEVAYNQLLEHGVPYPDDRRLVYMLYGAPSTIRRSTGHMGEEYLMWLYRIEERPGAEKAAFNLMGRNQYMMEYIRDPETGYRGTSAVSTMDLPPPLSEKEIARFIDLIDDESRSIEVRTSAAWRLRMDPGPEAMRVLLERVTLQTPGVSNYIAEAMFPLEFYYEEAVPSPATENVSEEPRAPILRYRPANTEILEGLAVIGLPYITEANVPALIQQMHDPKESFSSIEINTMERLTASGPTTYREGWLTPEESDSLYSGALGTAREMLNTGIGVETHAFLDPLLKQELLRNPEAFYLDAVALLMTETPGGRQLAVDRIQQAMRLDPGNGRYWLLLAKIQYARTLAYYTDDILDHVLDETPSMGDAYALKGQLRVEILWGLGWHSSGWWITPLNEGAQIPEEFQAEALDHLNRALIYDPDNRIATWFLGVNSLMVQDWESSIRVMSYLIAHEVHVAEAYLGRGLALQHLGMMELAMEDYEAGVRLLPIRAKHLVGDPRWAIPPSMGGIIQNADIAPNITITAENAFTDTFWRSKDTLFSTDVNERLAEQYRRFAYVTWRFAVPDLGRRGWESVRGQVYLRFGEPQESNARSRDVWNRMQRKLGTTEGAFSRARNSVDLPSEVWTYEDGLTFTFGGGLMSGNLTFWPSGGIDDINSLDDFRTLTEESPSSDSAVGFREVRPLQVHWYTFSNSDGNAEFVPIVAIEEFQNLRASGISISPYQPIKTMFMDEQWQLVSTTESQIPTWAWSTGPRNSWVGDWTTLSAETGPKYAAIEFIPEESSAPALASRDTLDVLVGENNLFLSSLIPANMVVSARTASEWAAGTHIIRNNLAIIPNPSAVVRSGAPIYICAEVYGLTKDEYGATHFEVSVSVSPLEEQNTFLAPVTDLLGRLIGRETQEGIVTLTFYRDGIATRSFERLPLAFMDETEPGNFNVVMTITDTNAGVQVSRSIVVTLSQ